MENQINVGDQNLEQVGQNPINQPRQIPERPKINYWMLSTILLFIVLLASGGWFILNSKNNNSSEQQRPTIIQANQTVTTGVIRTSGLSDEEKQKFGLTNVNYQITDFGDYQKTYQEGRIQGYYLISNNVNDELLGKCVHITGTIPEEWKNKNKADAYSRSVLNVAKIEKIDNSNCNPYSQNSQTQPTIDNSQEKLVLRGSVIRAKRPAPDIGYDYQLKLVEPFVDKLSSAGSPQKVSLVDVTPTTNNLWNELENNINKEVTVEGYMVWGYAESRYLQIMTINNHVPTGNAAAPKTYNSANLTLRYPSNWKVSTRQIEYYDFPTLELTKTGGTKMTGGYELPEIWIGSFEIYSTSGAICANEPECPKVDTISFTIKGKSYSTGVFRRQIWESGKFTGKYFYVFQIGSQSELDSVPSKPTITGQYNTTSEKAEIESILSSINY
ncbi:hypothetical protein HYW54_05600 [Candidatus Gottesmanbacteria bacterium]|nr:hypothetical protein [Candidatus Gottesmanbacteria bacterium]